MSAPVSLWLEINHHAAFRIGGWAFVRRCGEELSGHAGGQRRIDAERAALAGLIAVLSREPAGTAALTIRTTSRAVAAVPERIRAAAAGEAEGPADNLDLWAQAIAVLKARPVKILPADPGARASGFAAAWAEVGYERAKDKGDFTAAIPRPNLAKSGA